MNDGGPAFPREDYQSPPAPSGQTGMSLRDYFAAAALPHVIAVCNQVMSSEDNAIVEAAIAIGAYSIADAMLAERSKPMTVSTAMGEGHTPKEKELTTCLRQVADEMDKNPESTIRVTAEWLRASAAKIECQSRALEAGQKEGQRILAMLAHERALLLAARKERDAARSVLCDIRDWDMLNGVSRVADSEYWIARVKAALAAAGEQA